MNIKAIVFLLLGVLILSGCGDNKTSGDAAFNSYKEYLTGIPNSDFYSISKAITAYKNTIGNSNQAIKDTAFVEFRNLYYSVINKCSENFWNNQELITKLTTAKVDPEVTDFNKKLSDNGLRLSVTEGSFYIDEQPDFLYNVFNRYVSGSVKEYLSLRKNELEEGFSEDANLSITFRSLGDRIITWEDYINKYPASPFLAEAKFSYHLYLNTFITGLDNFPLSLDQKLKPEIKSEYENFISRHKNNVSGKIVENYYNILSQQNFILTPELDSFYKENGIEPMQGIQPPTR